MDIYTENLITLVMSILFAMASHYLVRRRCWSRWVGSMISAGMFVLVVIASYVERGGNITMSTVYTVILGLAVGDMLGRMWPSIMYTLRRGIGK